MAVKVSVGLALAALALIAVLWAPWWLLAIILGAVVISALVEFLALSGKLNRLDIVGGGVIGAAIVGAALLGEEFILMALTLGGVLGLLLVLFRPGDIKVSGLRASHLLTGLLYVAGLGALIMLMVNMEGSAGRHVLIMAAVVTWVNDSTAYLGGKAMGRHKMAPKVSPNKTWEGSFWGMVGSVGGAMIVWVLAFDSVPQLLWSSLGFALVGGAFGQVGDLAESMFKRTYAVKDSASFLPGHGGFLDRIDAFLFVAPLAYFWFFKWFPIV